MLTKKKVSAKSIYRENRILSFQMHIMLSVLIPFDLCTDEHINPLVPNVLFTGRLTKILISIMEGIHKKIPMSVATLSQ